MDKKGPEMNFQEMVYAAVERRGYIEGWEWGTLLWRQVLKMTEELAEFADLNFWPKLEEDKVIYHGLQYIGQLARTRFDEMRRDGPLNSNLLVNLDFLGDLPSEAADMQVVLCIMSEILNRAGYPSNIVNDALDKARGDVERGVRE